MSRLSRGHPREGKGRSRMTAVHRLHHHGAAGPAMMAPMDDRTQRGKVLVLPGEDEMKALAMGGLRVLRGEDEAQEYV